MEQAGSRRWGEFGMTVFLALYGITLLSVVFDYRASTRLFPLVMLSVLMILVAVKLGCLWIPRLSAILEPRVDLFDVGDLVTAENAPVAESPPSPQRLGTAIGSLLGFLFAILLFGYLIAIPVYLLLYCRLLARRSWLLSLTIALTTWAGTYLLFVKLLMVRLFEGFLFS